MGDYVEDYDTMLVDTIRDTGEVVIIIFFGATLKKPIAGFAKGDKVQCIVIDLLKKHILVNNDDLDDIDEQISKLRVNDNLKVSEVSKVSDTSKTSEVSKVSEVTDDAPKVTEEKINISNEEIEDFLKC
jgi:hypothetical protein